MSLIGLTLLAAEEREANPDLVLCPVASDADRRCGLRLRCHRPFDVGRAFGRLEPAFQPMQRTCPEFLVARWRALQAAFRPPPVRPADGSARLSFASFLSSRMPVSNGLSPLLRWLEEHDFCCYVQWATPNRNLVTVLYGYVSPGIGVYVHVVASGTGGDLAIVRTSVFADEGESMDNLQDFLRCHA